MSNRRIGIVLNTAWNIYNFRLGLIKELMECEVDIYAIAPWDNYVDKIVSETGCKYIPLKNLTRDGTNPINEYKLILELRNIYKKEKIDLILNYTIKPVIYGTLAAKGLDIKVVNTVTGLGYSFLSRGIVNKLVKSLYRFSLQYANLNLFQNKDDMNLFLKEKLVKKGKTGIVNGSGVNTDYFFPRKKERKNDNIYILFIGRLLYDKGIAELVEAVNLILKENKSIRFEIIGKLDIENPSAITQEDLDNWLKSENISYLGVVDDTRNYIAESDMVVLPSYREGLPRVMLEAMSMSKPIIATDVPGCRETIIDGYNGYLHKVKDVDSLTQVISKMIEINHDRRVLMGEKGREIVLERFDEKIIIKRYLKIINALWNE